eukprot:TRINITY_DN16170_c0_g1_i5.p1 TRINITY_DN16170_c0_g1~~TRINITY_DN16170_c0_g1_i5.p1  ORF type:complete len:255 (+),score=16.30 TRINITY_DN16170_c0_g1_i5:401-1165(+)
MKLCSQQDNPSEESEYTNSALIGMEYSDKVAPIGAGRQPIFRPFTKGSGDLPRSSPFQREGTGSYQSTASSSGATLRPISNHGHSQRSGLLSVSANRGGGKLAVKPVAQNSNESALKIILHSIHRLQSCKFCTSSSITHIKKGLYKKYEVETQNLYNVNIINDIIVNSKCHITACFKEYLIYDDVDEFLSGVYSVKEAARRFSVHPNYANLDEKEYMLKNQERHRKCGTMPASHPERVSNFLLFTQGFIPCTLR